MINRIKELVEILRKASYYYYALDNPFITDLEYDKLYDELLELEKSTGIVLAGSPTQKVQGYVLDGFKKVEHSKPMLSADKTKDINEIKSFIGNHKFYCSYKLDGLTLVVRYKDGKFVQGVTRGNGTIGEDVTEQCRFISNIPMKIPYQGELELRGECLISWEEFERINSMLKEPYKHPRNLAAGTLRNLDLNVLKDRELTFVVFECVTNLGSDSKLHVLNGTIAEKLGFEIVDFIVSDDFDNIVDSMNPYKYEYPVDGLIFEIDSYSESQKLGKTSHHENCRMALKWKDETEETVVTDIEWTMGKTGVLTPTAVFEPVELDGTTVQRANVHNVSILTKLDLCVGDKVEVYKANMIIPQIARNISAEGRKDSNYIAYPTTCPVCGGSTELMKENESIVLMCTNPNCSGKLLGKLSHMVSRDALNINGLSEATLEFLIDKGWVTSIADIYSLSQYSKKWSGCDGFGARSIKNILESIEESRSTTLDRFINSLSIPLIGKSSSKIIAKHFNYDPQKLLDAFNNNYTWHNIDGFSTITAMSIKSFWTENKDSVISLMNELHFEIPETKQSSESLKGKTFVITGKLNKFSNRDTAKEQIEAAGGKVSGSVSKNTSYLVNNDNTSNSSKNKKAKELGVEIITEEQLIAMLG